MIDDAVVSGGIVLAIIMKRCPNEERKRIEQ